MVLQRSVVLALLVLVVVISGCDVGVRSLRGLPAGVEVTLRAKAGSLPSDPAKRDEMMQAARDVLMKRLQGERILVEPSIRVDGDRLVVDLPGIIDGRKAADDLVRRGSLDFYYMKGVETSDHPGMWKMEHPAAEGEAYLFTGPGGKTVNSKADPEAVLLKVVDAYEPVKNPDGQKPVLTGADLIPNAAADLDRGAGPIIRIQFNPTGTKVFREFTRAHIGEIVAIFYDGKLVTAPVIKDTIPNGQAQISGLKSISDAQNMVDTLNAGSLPVSLEVVGVMALPGRASR